MQYEGDDKLAKILVYALIVSIKDNEEKLMSLMTVAEVAEFLGVKELRVERLERESLLISKDKDGEGKPLFDKQDVEKYKEFAERIGGI